MGYSIRNLILVVNSATVSYLLHYDSLLQNATDITTKRDSYFITKCNKSLLQNVSHFLLQNATFSLQNLTVILNCNKFITNYNSYRKIRGSLQIVTVLATETIENRVWNKDIKVTANRLAIIMKNVGLSISLFVQSNY